MAAWILIIIISSNNGKAIDHIEFSSEQACNNAQALLPTYNNSFSSYNAYCAKK